jgi:hypothetical protein
MLSHSLRQPLLQQQQRQSNPNQREAKKDQATMGDSKPPEENPQGKKGEETTREKVPTFFGNLPTPMLAFTEISKKSKELAEKLKDYLFVVEGKESGSRVSNARGNQSLQETSARLSAIPNVAAQQNDPEIMLIEQLMHMGYEFGQAELAARHSLDIEAALDFLKDIGSPRKPIMARPHPASSLRDGLQVRRGSNNQLDQVNALLSSSKLSSGTGGDDSVAQMSSQVLDLVKALNMKMDAFQRNEVEVLFQPNPL